MNILQQYSKNFWSTKKGTATGISLGFSTGILAISLGTVAIVGDTVKTNKNVENSSVAYFSAERGIEYSLLDISGHISGYELEKGDKKGNLKSLNKESKTQIAIESRSKSEDIDGVQTITIPAQNRGNATINKDWNTLPKGQSISIPLYIDNTSK